MRHLIAPIMALTTAGCHVRANQAVVTQHNDVRRTGANLAERSLTPTRVSAGMRLRVWRPLDGNVSVQALYVPRVSIGGGWHNVIYVETLGNVVDAYDADDTTNPGTTQGRLWRTQLPVSPDPLRPYPLAGGLGIQGTPVIDVAANTMYVVYGVDNGAFPPGGQGDAGYVVAFHIAALDIRSGAVLRDSVVHARVPSAVAPGYAEFAPQRQVERAGLLLTPDAGSRGPKSVYLAFASRWHEETHNWHGWVMRYDAATFNLLSAFCSTPDRRDVSEGGGIWEGGGGLGADDSLSVYFLTGNGPAGTNSYGNSIVKLTPVAGTSPGTYGLTVASFSAAADDPAHATEWANDDIDLGGGGLMLVPGTPTLVGGGKTGVYYVMNTAGGLSKVQEFAAFTNRYNPGGRYTDWQSGPHLHGSPTYWAYASDSGFVYHWAEKDSLRRYTYHYGSGALDSVHAVAAPLLADNFVMPGGNISLSANGRHDGVLWVTHPLSVGGEVMAFDAVTLQPLWHDSLPDPAHFVPPTVTNGRVIVPTGNGTLLIYELAPPATPPVRIPRLKPVPWWLIPLGDPAPRVQAVLGELAPREAATLRPAEATLRFSAAVMGVATVVADEGLHWVVRGVDGVVIDDMGMRPSMGYGGRGDTLAVVSLTTDALMLRAPDQSTISARVLASVPSKTIVPWQLFGASPGEQHGVLGSVSHIQLLNVGADDIVAAPTRAGETQRVRVRGLIVFYGR